MSGDEPSQLHGNLEVLAIPGDELMPCAIAVAGRNDPRARALAETPVCRKSTHPGSDQTNCGQSAGAPTSNAPSTSGRRSRRWSSAAARPALPRASAMLAAGKEMSRLGLYPKTTTLMATAVDCASASPLFRIVDAQFDVGLFQDIAEALETPGEEVDKSMGAYVTHRDYTTSREINDFLAAGNSVFFVEARGRCWRLTVTRPR